MKNAISGKIFSFLAIMLIIVSFPAFSSGSKEEASGKIELTLATPDNSYGLSTDPDLQQAVTDMIEAKNNVEISPIIPPLSSYPDKLATLVNSGDVPDVFAVSQAMTKIPQMVARGQIMDLTGFVENSEAMKIIDSSYFDPLRIDGKIYSIPYKIPKVKVILLRKDIMQEYGINLSSTPTTEEFISEMSKLAGSGIEPFTFPKWVDNFQFFYNSFGAWGGVYLKDGKYVDGFQEPEMRAALAYINRLYEEGVLNKEFITTENSQMMEKVYTAQSAADIDYITNYINYIQNSEKAGKPTEMHVIYCLVGPEGFGGALNEATQTAWAVSSKTKHPEEAFAVIESIVTDEDIYPAFYGIGVEGYHYTLDENKNIVPTAKASNSGYNYTLNYLSDSFLGIDVNDLDYSLDPSIVDGLTVQNQHIKDIVPYIGPNYSADVPVGVSDAYDRVSPSIKSTRESIAAKIAMGSVTVDEGMEEYMNFWNSINGPEILEELNSSL